VVSKNPIPMIRLITLSMAPQSSNPPYLPRWKVARQLDCGPTSRYLRFFAVDRGHSKGKDHSKGKESLRWISLQNGKNQKTSFAKPFPTQAV
jgi:hypothetical protein